MSNCTVNFILKMDKENARGMVPLYLRITMLRKTAYMATSHFIPEKHWNEKTQTVRDINLYAKAINTDLSRRRNQVLQKITELEVAGKPISAKIIKDQFSGKDPTNIFNFIDQYCEDVKHKKSDATIVVYNREKNTFLQYHGSENLSFEDITADYLKKFEKYLRDKGYENNYIFGIFKTLRVFFNAAIKRGLITHYPFKEYENPIYKQPKKQRLTMEELHKWEEYVSTCDNKVWKQAGLYFLFACYCGLRVSDWKAFDIKEHLNDGMIRIKPTKESTGFVSVPVSKPLDRLIKQMEEIPLSIEEPTINEKLKFIADKLEIKKRISTHTGRHTFAITICAEQGVSCEVCAKLMGITISTCERNYYRVSQKKIHDETAKAWGQLI